MQSIAGHEGQQQQGLNAIAITRSDLVFRSSARASLADCGIGILQPAAA
jgi:hypothetical protein